MEKARAQRIKELMEKVQEVRNWKEDLIQSQRNFLKSSQSVFNFIQIESQLTTGCDSGEARTREGTARDEVAEDC